MGPKVKSAIKYWMFFPVMFAGLFLGPWLGLNGIASLGFGLILYWLVQMLVWPRVWRGEIVTPDQWRKIRIGGSAWVMLLFVACLFFGWLQEFGEARRQAKASTIEAAGFEAGTASEK